MRTTLTLLLFLTVSTLCKAQEYYCPVSNGGGVVTKFDQWFLVSDSLVKTKTIFKGKENSAAYTRKSSTNESTIYWTDGVVTSSLTILETPGTVKGYKYSYQAIFIPNINNQPSSGIFYCERIQTASKQ